MKESETKEGICSYIGTVVVTGRHSQSSWCKIKTIYSSDYNIGETAKHINANKKANKSMLIQKK